MGTTESVFQQTLQSTSALFQEFNPSWGTLNFVRVNVNFKLSLIVEHDRVVTSLGSLTPNDPLEYILSGNIGISHTELVVTGDLDTFTLLDPLINGGSVPAGGFGFPDAEDLPIAFHITSQLIRSTGNTAIVTVHNTDAAFPAFIGTGTVPLEVTQPNPPIIDVIFGLGDGFIDNVIVSTNASGSWYNATVTYDYEPNPVDLDADGDVDGADFLIVQRTSPLLIPQWQTEYGSSTSLVAGQSVPEPSTLVLGLFVVFESYFVRLRQFSWR